MRSGRSAMTRVTPERNAWSPPTAIHAAIARASAAEARSGPEVSRTIGREAGGQDLVVVVDDRHRPGARAKRGRETAARRREDDRECLVRLALLVRQDLDRDRLRRLAGKERQVSGATDIVGARRRCPVQRRPVNRRCARSAAGTGHGQRHIDRWSPLSLSVTDVLLIQSAARPACRCRRSILLPNSAIRACTSPGGDRERHELGGSTTASSTTAYVSVTVDEPASKVTVFEAVPQTTDHDRRRHVEPATVVPAVDPAMLRAAPVDPVRVKVTTTGPPPSD